jgi:hypothetical protein
MFFCFSFADFGFHKSFICDFKEFLLFRELESELDAENRRFGDAQKVSKLTISHLPVFYLII